MRVITGSARGHKLRTPEGRSTRPTTDKIKESLFNMLAPELYDCEFLDLFSGSGAIGIEALSRGAKSAVFSDISTECIELIKSNLKFTKLFEKAEVYKQEAIALVQELGRKGRQFDLIFLDPPYESGMAMPVLEAIVKHAVLKKDGLIVVERASECPLSPVEGLKITREKKYSKTTMTFLTMEEF